MVITIASSPTVPITLTQRTTLVEEHKGQVSFPGGSMDPGDADVIMTALRESDEEIGLRSEHVKLIGRIDDYVMNPGRYHISVLVGEIDPALSPYVWQPAPAEVAEVLEVPLSHFLDPENHIRYTSAARDGVDRHRIAVDGQYLGRVAVKAPRQILRSEPKVSVSRARDGADADFTEPG